MNNTPTPRTDFAIKASNGQWSYVLKLCDEKLERELTAAREKLKAVTEQRDEARELALNFRDALVSIEEYWNRDQNETAMADACWHAVNMAHDALAKAKEVLP